MGAPIMNTNQINDYATKPFYGDENVDVEVEFEAKDDEEVTE